MRRMEGSQNRRLAAQKLRGAEKGYLPLKSSDSRMRNMDRYGGFEKFTGTYFFVVEHRSKKKKVREMEALPLYLKEQLDTRDKLEHYCRETLGYEDPRIVCERIRMYSLLKVNGFYLYLTGRSNNRLTVMNAVQMVLDYESLLYIKRITEANDRGYMQKDYEDHETIHKREKSALILPAERKAQGCGLS